MATLEFDIAETQPAAIHQTWFKQLHRGNLEAGLGRLQRLALLALAADHAREFEIDPGAPIGESRERETHVVPHARTVHVLERCLVVVGFGFKLIETLIGQSAHLFQLPAQGIQLQSVQTRLTQLIDHRSDFVGDGGEVRR